MKKNFIKALVCCYMSAFFICNQTQAINASAAPVVVIAGAGAAAAAGAEAAAANARTAEGVIIDTGNQNIDRFIYDLTYWIDEQKQNAVENIEQLQNIGVKQKLKLIGKTSIFAYYLTDYYNTHPVGTGIITPESSSGITGIYKIENDEKLYTATATTLAAPEGILINALHYSVYIRFSVESNNEITVSDMIKNFTPYSNRNASHQGVIGATYSINRINGATLVKTLNGTGLFHSYVYRNTWGNDTVTISYNRQSGIPTITDGYNYTTNYPFTTYYTDSILTLPTAETPINDNTPWDYYNNNLLPQILEEYPELVPDDFPFHGEPFKPATATDPTEPETTKPRYELETIPDLWQPVTEIIEITNDSSEVIETQIETVTDTNGEPISEPKIPMLPTIPIEVEPFPDWFIPLDLWDTIAGIWEAMKNTMEETELMKLLPFVMIVGLVGFGLKYIGG